MTVVNFCASPQLSQAIDFNLQILCVCNLIADYCLPHGGAHLARNWGRHPVQQPARNWELGGRFCPSWAWRWLQSWQTSWRLCRKPRLGDPAKSCLDSRPCSNYGINKCVLISVTKFWSNLLGGNRWLIHSTSLYSNLGFWGLHQSKKYIFSTY